MARSEHSLTNIVEQGLMIGSILVLLKQIYIQSINGVIRARPRVNLAHHRSDLVSPRMPNWPHDTYLDVTSTIRPILRTYMNLQSTSELLTLYTYKHLVTFETYSILFTFIWRISLQFTINPCFIRISPIISIDN